MGQLLKHVSYDLPVDFSCPCCGSETACIVPLDNSFDFEDGTGGGVHHPSNFGAPVSDCCEAPVPNATICCPF